MLTTIEFCDVLLPNVIPNLEDKTQRATNELNTQYLLKILISLTFIWVAIVSMANKNRRPFYWNEETSAIIHKAFLAQIRLGTSYLFDFYCVYDWTTDRFECVWNICSIIRIPCLSILGIINSNPQGHLKKCFCYLIMFREQNRNF